MEVIWLLVTAFAPVAWGSTYWVTREFLPVDAPLWGALLRALPAGIVLLAFDRQLPRGAWWWRSAVLGTLNVGAFFALVYVAATLLPTSIATTLMATSPVVIMLFAWLLLGQRPRPRAVLGAVIGFAGVTLLIAGGGGSLDLRGVAASAAAMVCSSAGYALSTRWGHETKLVSMTAWQLLAGGILLLPVVVAVEGAPPHIGVEAGAGFAYLALFATAAAFVAWFAGLRHLTASTVGLVGLLNPVTGVLLGVAFSGEHLASRQLLGLAVIAAGILVGLSLGGSAGRSGRTSEGDAVIAVPFAARE